MSNLPFMSFRTERSGVRILLSKQTYAPFWSTIHGFPSSKSIKSKKILVQTVKPDPYRYLIYTGY